MSFLSDKMLFYIEVGIGFKALNPEVRIKTLICGAMRIDYLKSRGMNNLKRLDFLEALRGFGNYRRDGKE